LSKNVAPPPRSVKRVLVALVEDVLTRELTRQDEMAGR